MGNPPLNLQPLLLLAFNSINIVIDHCPQKYNVLNPKAPPSVHATRCGRSAIVIPAGLVSFDSQRKLGAGGIVNWEVCQ